MKILVIPDVHLIPLAKTNLLPIRHRNVAESSIAAERVTGSLWPGNLRFIPWENCLYEDPLIMIGSCC